MKRSVSLLCMAAIVLSMFAVCAVSASAVDSAQTVVDVKAGDEVTYLLTLGGVPEPIECADYSVFYDSEVFDVTAVADYTDNFDEDQWGPNTVINYDLTNEIHATFIYTKNKGLDFSSTRNFITVKFTAKKDASTHISYFIKDMAGESYFVDDSKPVISEYVFSCSVTVNGEAVIEDAQPELNVDEVDSPGTFVNSVSGDSKDADANISNEIKKNSASKNNNSGSGSDDSSNDSGNGSDNGSKSAVPGNKTVVETNAAGEVISVSTVDEADIASPAVVDSNSDSGKKSGSTGIWIAIVVIAVAACGGFAYYYMKKKNSSGDASADDKSDMKSDDKE